MTRLDYFNQVNFLAENITGRSYQELTDMYNDHFKLHLTVSGIKARCYNHNLKNGLRDTHFYATQEQLAFIKDHITGRPLYEVAELFNNRFGINIDTSKIKYIASMHGLRSGLRDEGQRNSKPVGTEEMTSQGYINVKVSAKPSVWRHKHALVWEAAYGPIPDGHVVIFGDGDRNNYSLDNLLLVSRRQLAMLARFQLFGCDAEITKTGLAVAELYLKICEINQNKTARTPTNKKYV